MRITRIKSVNHRIFKNFRWDGHGLEDFARYNLIYGWNFSGKTTLSNLFQLIENRVDLTEGTAIFTCEGNRELNFREISKSTVLPEVRVFNRRFIDKHVGLTSAILSSPIYVVIGDSAPELQSQFEEKRRQMGKLTTNEIPKRENEKTRAEHELSSFGTDQARFIRQTLGKPGNGYYNYERPRFFKECDIQDVPHILTEEEYRVYKNQSEAIAKPIVDQVNIQVPDLDVFYSQVREILQRDILSKPITELVSDSTLSEWIHNPFLFMPVLDFR